MRDSVREIEFVVEREYVGGGERVCGPMRGVWVRRKKLVRGILVFSIGPLAKMSHFYCSVAKMRPFIVWRPN